MASWELIPCLKVLFAEFDRIAPSRDHASDGSIGDSAHQAEVSDHNADEVGSVPIHDADDDNEVHAIDVDDNLNESDLTMEKAVQFILGRCRSGVEGRLRYIIYNRRIWRASNSWQQETYTGSSPHTEHAHFSASYNSGAEANTSSWHLEDIPVALTSGDKTWIQQTVLSVVESQRDDIANDVKVALTSTTAFASGGGQHSPVGDGVLNSSYPAEDGAQRTLLWVNLQRMQTDVTALETRMSNLDQKLDAILAAVGSGQ
jgi:hypothetical protein